MKEKIKSKLIVYKKCNRAVKIMKISILLFFLCLFSLTAENAYPQLMELSLDLKNVTIKKAISEIEKTSDYVFLITDEAKPELNKKTSLHVDKEVIHTVLDMLLEDTEIGYAVVERQVSLYKDVSSKAVETPIIEKKEIEQQKRITGKVTDKNGESIIGANIIEEGTSNGTITDMDGNFSLQIENNATIRVSYIGYITQNRVTVSGTTVNIVLEEDIQSLEEVVIVGYGQQKKASVVGSIVQVSGENLQRTGGTVNLGLGLTGQLPGVTVIQSTGEPGREDPSISIRSMGTWNNSQPLILVDGVERKMGDIDMNEVENVSVLKDASATSVFGVKGAQGVILITTKRGKLGKPVISFDVNMNTKTVSRVAEKHNSYDQFAFRNQTIEYQLNRFSGQDWDSYMPQRMLQYYKQPQANGLQYIFPDVDWKDEMLKPLPISYRANMNVSGGTEFAKYFASVAYTFDDDLIRTDADPMNRGYKASISYERINFRSNLDLNITKSTVFSANLAGYVSNKRNSLAQNAGQIFSAFSSFSPDMYPILQYDGSYGYNPQLTNNPNPLSRANSSGVQSNRQTSVTTDFRLKQNLDFITKGLSVGVLFSYDNIYNTTSSIADGGQGRSLYIDPAVIDILYAVNGSYIDENGNFYVKDGYRIEDYMDGYIFNQGGDHDFDWSKGTPSYTSESSSGSVFRKMFYQAQLNYDRSFGKHEVGALAVFNREQFATGSMFPRYREDWVGRVTYNYDSRYLFESNFAYNGSERFSSKYRFGFFPSVAVGWMVTQENFLQPIKWLSRLKFRYSFGKIGNDDFGGSRWSYRNNWIRDEDRTIYGYPNYINSPYVQYYESAVANPDLRWETAIKQNLGIEIGTLKNRINLNLDFFREHRIDIFMAKERRTIPEYFGQSASDANIGETKGEGYELELSLKNRFGKHLNAFFTLTHTGAFDEIIYMEDPPLLPDYKKNAGYQINQVVTQIDAGYTNNWNDVYSATGFSGGNTERMPGEYRILDFNGDGVIDANDSAPYFYPRDRPQHTYGVMFGGDYKGFSLMLQFYGVYNVTQLNSWQVFPFGNLSRTGPVLTDFAENSWTPENMDAKYRAMNVFLSGAQSLGTFAYVDGSYLRLKTAEIGYTLNPSMTKYLGVSALRFFLNGNNLFLWSKMIDDREGTNSTETMYPLVRRFNFGLSVKF